MYDIGVDLDGVIYPFAEDFMSYVGIDMNLDTYDFFVNYGIDRAKFKEICDLACRENKLYYSEPIDDAVYHLNRLKATGNKIHIITARGFCENSEEATLHWLTKYEIPYDSFTISDDKTCIKTDFFLEDHIKNYLLLEKAGTNVYLVNRPWNKDFHANHRVNNIGEFVDLILDLSYV